MQQHPDEPRPLNYALPAPRWTGSVSAAVGAMGILWLSMGIALWQTGDPAAGARALKYVLLACIPSTLVGLVLGLAGMSARARLAAAGVAMNGLVLVTAAGVLIYAYWFALAG